MMNLSHIRDLLPEAARDLRLNLDQVLSESGAPGLDARQIAFIALACALAVRQARLRAAVWRAAGAILSEEERAAAVTCAALMGMNNVYYRFTHLVGVEDYRQMPARLRMNALARPGIDTSTFELGCLAVSAINGCGACLSAHEALLRRHGVSVEAIQSAARIAAVLHGVAVALDAEMGAEWMSQAA